MMPWGSVRVQKQRKTLETLHYAEENLAPQMMQLPSRTAVQGTKTQTYHRDWQTGGWEKTENGGGAKKKPNASHKHKKLSGW